MKKAIVAFTFGEESIKEDAIVKSNKEVLLLWEIFLKDGKGEYKSHYTVPKTQAVIQWLPPDNSNGVEA
ncbi:hypothetical protein KY346_00705 [Candidatus Woesearchaeota archaeon]|nr:hypothetical protein [Candidatus Woesearchaeota archaeon]